MTIIKIPTIIKKMSQYISLCMFQPPIYVPVVFPWSAVTAVCANKFFVLFSSFIHTHIHQSVINTLLWRPHRSIIAVITFGIIIKIIHIKVGVFHINLNHIIIKCVVEITYILIICTGKYTIT